MKKILLYSGIFLTIFLLSTNICFNIINKSIFNWNFNILLQLSFLKTNTNFLLGILLLFSLFILFILKYKYKLKVMLKNKEEIPKKDGSLEFGSTRFLTSKEIKKTFKVWNENNKINQGGIVVTNIGNKNYYDSSTDHTIIVGSTGSGKTVSCIMPLIFNLIDAEESLIINDTKGELFNISYKEFKNKGYHVKIINLRDAIYSDRFNPLYLPYKFYKEGNIEKCIELLDDFSYTVCSNVSSKDPFWEQASASVLTALMLGIVEDAKNEEEVNMTSVYNLLVEHGNRFYGRENSLDKYFNEKPFGSISKNYYATGNFSKGETRGSIFSVLASKLKIFADTGIINMTSRMDINIENLGNRKTVIFLIIPDEKEARHVLASLFIDQVYQILVYYANKNNGSLKKRVNFILDEFANMPSINNFSNKITVSRSRNIRFYLVIQDFNQLKSKYKDEHLSIRSNCGNLIYLLTSDFETAKEISNRLGKYTISTSRSSISSKIGGTDFNNSIDKSLQGRELLMPDEIMKMKVGEGLFIKTRIQPIKINLKTIYRYNLNIGNSELPKEKQENNIQIFNLDEFRLKQKLLIEEDKVEL